MIWKSQTHRHTKYLQARGSKKEGKQRCSVLSNLSELKIIDRKTEREKKKKISSSPGDPERWEQRDFQISVSWKLRTERQRERKKKHYLQARVSQKGGKQRCSVLLNLSDLEIMDRQRDKDRQKETATEKDTETERDIQIERQTDRGRQ